MRFTFTLLFAAVFSASCFAQGIGPGATIEPKADLPLRHSPPSGIAGDKGDTIGTAKANAKYRVLDSKTFSTITGGETWLKVLDASDPSKSGWIFSGTRDVPYGNVKLAR